MACRSAASSSLRCKRLASFSASLASSTISLEPLLSCLRAAQASSFNEPMPRRDSSVSLAVSQDASSSKPERMLDPVVPISSWQQVILALLVVTSPSWKRCSSSASQSGRSYFPIWPTMEFIVFFFALLFPRVSFTDKFFDFLLILSNFY